jgi:hypothetical protein
MGERPEPSDAEVAAQGYKAFKPRRDPFVPTDEHFQRARRDVLPSDGQGGEYAALAQALADAYPDMMAWAAYYWAGVAAWGGVWDVDEDLL